MVRAEQQAELRFDDGFYEAERRQALYDLDTGDENARYQAALRMLRVVGMLEADSKRLKRSDPGWALQRLDDAIEIALEVGAIQKAGVILDRIAQLVPVVYPGDEAFKPLFRWHLKTWRRKSLHLRELAPSGAQVEALEVALKQYPGCAGTMKRLGRALIEEAASEAGLDRGKRLIERARALVEASPL